MLRKVKRLTFYTPPTAQIVVERTMVDKNGKPTKKCATIWYVPGIDTGDGKAFEVTSGNTLGVTKIDYYDFCAANENNCDIIQMVDEALRKSHAVVKAVASPNPPMEPPAEEKKGMASFHSETKVGEMVITVDVALPK